MNNAVRIVVSGMVQGVGFRYFIQHHAEQLGLTGWVRNLANGDVEIEAQGDRSAVESLIAFARRGPRSAVVSKADVTWKSSGENYDRFEISYY